MMDLVSTFFKTLLNTLILMLPAGITIAQATPLSPSTRAQVEALRAQIDIWAPMCNGAMALNKDCYQFDMIEYAGYRCATGDTERCKDIQEAQAPDGRFWRSKTLIGQSTSDSFSRDMFMGLMFYFSKTKDVGALTRWLDYLSSHRNRMCDDATDNRCTLMPTTWGMLGLNMRYLGLRPSLKMRLGGQLIAAEMLISALTAPLGFELVLIADNIIFMRSIGLHTSWMDRAARIALKRQPLNPLFQYLANGSTEELGQQLIAMCPAGGNDRMDDVFWQRKLEKNSSGEVVVVRDDWGADNSHIPVSKMSNGHDCIIAMNLLLRGLP